MNSISMPMSFTLSAGTVKERSKERNGDAVCHAQIAGGSFVAAMVADGVGQCPCDWLASQLATERFLALATTEPSLVKNPAAGLKTIIERIDGEIGATSGRGRGMKCAANAVLWQCDSDNVWFANIGDTRLYGISTTQHAQISTDESQAIVRRGQDGKPLISGGAAVVQRGITNALGSGEAKVSVSTCRLPPGGALVLASDGFYDCSPDFLKDVTRVWSHADLDAALSMLLMDYSGRNRDDATVLILRRAFPTLTWDQVVHAIAGCREPAIPQHAIALAIGERLPELVTTNAIGSLHECLDFLDRNEIVLSRSRAEALLKQMAGAKWMDRRSFSALIAMIRQQP